MNTQFMQKQILTFSALLLFTSVLIFAQKGEKDHVVTWTPTSILGTKINLGYEYTISPKLGLKTGVGFVVMNNADISLNFIDDSVDDGSLTTNPKFTGIDITPELRWYVGGRGAEGFYLGPFLRYYQYGLSEFSYQFTDGGNVDREGLADFDINAIGGGLILGGQWIANSGFTFGINGGFGMGGLNIKGEVRNISGITPEEYKDLEQDFIDELDSDVNSSSLSRDILGVYSTSNSVGIDSKRLPVPIVRFGIVFGWAF